MGDDRGHGNHDPTLKPQFFGLQKTWEEFVDVVAINPSALFGLITFCQKEGLCDVRRSLSQL
jgi:hypothetical protein